MCVSLQILRQCMHILSLSLYLPLSLTQTHTHIHTHTHTLFLPLNIYIYIYIYMCVCVCVYVCLCVCATTFIIHALFLRSIVYWCPNKCIRTIFVFTYSYILFQMAFGGVSQNEDPHKCSLISRQI